jgi:release factor glutamine methyltransferase
VREINKNLVCEMEKYIINSLINAGCVFAEEEARLLIEEARTMDELKKMVELRAGGLPLEHVIGFTVFSGLRISVDRGVFVPRTRTEFLVRQSEALVCEGNIIVDLCCGTGAVGAALAKATGQMILYAVDIDTNAVCCAARNLSVFGGRVFQGDLYEALPRTLQGRVDLIVANAPYVPSQLIELLPQEARIHEPKAALDGGEDGLNLQRRIVKEAQLWLASGGHLLVETSERQALQTFEIFTSNGLITKVARNEQLDATVVIGTKPGF